MIIETPHLVLRPIMAADARALIDLDSDPSVMRYVSGGRPTPAHIISDWVIPRAITAMSAHRGDGMWVAIDPAQRAFLGWFSLRAPRHSPQHELELTYRLRQAVWGRGFATEGSRALVATAFDHGRAERVFAGTMAVNTASRRVMEKSGMRLAALHLAADPGIDGHERGEVEYEILRTQWTAEEFPWAGSVRHLSNLIA
ncbi:GNAT family N-acetyltransferase [Williamsia sp. CHRR-6]|uniref:GNAT family N-acetyltransferase n=1 Tax=Williamsia sp. CHRR-6 TaxID=2835871 RepID=UPI001BD993B7|nr:GNAT family N-acetyltransferase [Williamsia sp. CHRR-6]MBT0568195.1 GNAT family N-acetyltransferase [Williamsia sp. CHRR-6]